MGLTKLLGKLSFTTHAVLQGRIQCRYLKTNKLVLETNKLLTSKSNIKTIVKFRWWKNFFLIQEITEDENARINV